MTPILIPLRDESCPVSPRSFFCRCSNGQFSYRYGNSCEVDDKDGEDFPVKLIILLGVGIGVGLLCSVCLGYYLYLFLKKRKYKIRKEKFFKQNGLTRSQNVIEIDQIPLLLEDEVPFAFTRSSGDPAQDSTNDNVSLEMEAVSM
ncbi:hypothetical protein OIU78_022488 [Salix suchowensis]|nr:hypothetical protein OIU78_022488 [Salix suchowensis]